MCSTICNFWCTIQQDKSIVPLPDTLGNSSDSSQYHLISRTKSIHNTAIAVTYLNIEEYNIIYEKQNCKKDSLWRNQPRILQFPNHSACRQNCAKRDCRGAPFMTRQFLFSTPELAELLVPNENINRRKTNILI
jgi:hypothetical protein